jgi:hypothetical protein
MKPSPRRSIGAIEIAVAVGIAICVAARIAGAQSAEAEALFDQANKLMAEGKLVEACEAFESSKRIEPRAGTLIRLGECREANHQLASAWTAYQEALTRVKDQRKRDIATARVTALVPRLSTLVIEIGDDARIDGLVVSRNGNPIEPSAWNRAMPVDGGDVVIAAHAPGHTEWRNSVRIPDEAGVIVMRVPKLAEVVHAQKLAMPRVTSVRMADTSSRWTATRRVAVGFGGAAAIATATAVVLGLRARGLERDAFASCDPEVPCALAGTAQATLDRAHDRALIANIGFGIGAGAAITAGILWFVGRPRDSRVHATATGIAWKF